MGSQSYHWVSYHWCRLSKATNPCNAAMLELFPGLTFSLGLLSVVALLLLPDTTTVWLGQHTSVWPVQVQDWRSSFQEEMDTLREAFAYASPKKADPTNSNEFVSENIDKYERHDNDKHEYNLKSMLQMATAEEKTHDDADELRTANAYAVVEVAGVKEKSFEQDVKTPNTIGEYLAEVSEKDEENPDMIMSEIEQLAVELAAFQLA